MSNESKSPFAFEIGQFVRLEDREGQVTARTDYGHREPGYCVQYMLHKTFLTSGSICTSTRGISESELLKLQPADKIDRAEAGKLIDAAFHDGQRSIREGLAHMRKMRRRQAARRKARKSTSRKRR